MNLNFYLDMERGLSFPLSWSIEIKTAFQRYLPRKLYFQQKQFVLSFSFQATPWLSSMEQIINTVTYLNVFQLKKN